MRRFLACAVLLGSLVARAQSPGPSVCPQDEKVIKGLLQELVANRIKGGFASVPQYYADDAVISNDDGQMFTKSEFVAAMNKELSENEQTFSPERKDLSVKFVDGVAIASYIEEGANTVVATGAHFAGTSRESRIFACEGGVWKIIFRSEIQRPNAMRAPVESERSHFDEYVGHYRIVSSGKMLGEITVTRSGDKLFEAWGKDHPEEILPGGHDTFFFRGDSMVEQFVRDPKNKVVGIHYIYWDDHAEAKRVD